MFRSIKKFIKQYLNRRLERKMPSPLSLPESMYNECILLGVQEFHIAANIAIFRNGWNIDAWIAKPRFDDETGDGFISDSLSGCEEKIRIWSQKFIRCMPKSIELQNEWQICYKYVYNIGEQSIERMVIDSLGKGKNIDKKDLRIDESNIMLSCLKVTYIDKKDLRIT